MYVLKLKGERIRNWKMALDQGYLSKLTGFRGISTFLGKNTTKRE